MDFSNSGSWIWKSIGKLRSLARPFIVCKVETGISCRFWTDNWTKMGPLVDLTGDSGPRLTGLPRDAVVIDAIRDGDWWISSSRSRNPTICLLKDCLPSPSVVVSQEEEDLDDCYLWKVGDAEASGVFSSAKTWHFLHPQGEKKDWCDAVWFKGRIPKHAFIAWVNARHRLNTRDRLIGWGLAVPSLCLLCNTHDESRQHLFFDCCFSAEVWSFFTGRAAVSPPVRFEDAVLWLKSPSRDKNISLILKLAFHASAYLLWKERNSRLYNSSSKPASALILEAKSILRCHLDPLSRAQKFTPPELSYLATWLGLFQP
ncbi:Reverse transcriptase zinc-binding domain [Arabidopsis suecica]|uniref:Reverse transcriptase zinc-binding domain n=1 Tax=Arabidopsis suecica TaxID=45249 RepID=A0A8T2BX43_ARASU|nr:Reverse transcriptase zinc-binding domain [Arabidopsis suecica]